MANTLKFGNGEWYGKKDTILAYNDENNNYKPLPFNFSRASSATFVNKDGLIETVGIGEPRVDYLNDSNGALLLEPSRTNISLYSEDYTQGSWSKTSVTVESNSVIAPDGSLTADKLDFSASTSARMAQLNSPAAGTYTFSVYLRSVSGTGTFNIRIQSTGDTPATNIVTLNEEWQRVEVTINYTATNPLVSYIGYYIDDSYLQEVYAWGAQLELGSYATSYIPTSGSSVTRAAEVSYQTVPSGVIGQTEGTIFVYFEFNQTPSDINGRIFGLWATSDTTNSIIALINQSNQLQVSSFSSSSGAAVIPADPATLIEFGRIKIAIAYTSTSITVYINGVLFASGNPTGYFPTSLTSIGIGSSPTSVRSLGCPIKQTILYNTRLSNFELKSLTS